MKQTSERKTTLSASENVTLRPRALFAGTLGLILLYSLGLAWSAPDLFAIAGLEGAAFGLVLIFAHSMWHKSASWLLPIAFAALNAAFVAISPAIILVSEISLDGLGVGEDVRLLLPFVLTAGLGGFLALFVVDLFLRPNYLSLRSYALMFALTGVSGVWLMWLGNSPILLVIHKANWWLAFCVVLYLSWRRSRLRVEPLEKVLEPR